MQFTAAIQVYFKRIMSKLTAKTSLQGDSMKDHQSKMRTNEAKAEGCTHLGPQKRGYRQPRDGQRQEISKVEGDRQ